MNERRIQVPWDDKIKEYIVTLIEQIGNLTGVPLQIHHLGTNEFLSNSLAQGGNVLDAPGASSELRIGSTPVILIKALSKRREQDPKLEATVQLVHHVTRKYLQSQAEIESFSREVLDNYKIINMLYRVADALGDVQDVNRITSIILHQAVAITHAERGSVLLLDKEAKRFWVAAAYGFSRENLGSETVKVSESLCGKVLETGRPLIVEDIRTRPDLLPYSKGDYKTGSFISIPLQTARGENENQILGILNVSDKKAAESFKSNDLKLLNALTAQASVVIANAQVLKELKHSEEELHDTLQELMKTNEDLEKRAVFIDQLNKIALSINATLDLDHLFHKISAYAKTLTNSEEAVVYYPKNSDEEPPSIEEEPFSLSDSLASGNFLEAGENEMFFEEILNSGKAVFWDSATEGKLPRLNLRECGEVEIRSFLGIPFFSKGKTIGVIAVVNKASGDGFVVEDRALLATLGNQVANAVENAKLIADQKVLFLNTITALAAAVDAKDPYTHNHSRKVAYYSAVIGKGMALSDEEMGLLEQAAILHDIGKIATPESILNKPGRLTREEYDVIKTHPPCGVKIVENIKEMELILPAMKYHHERYDGKGYPEGLRGEEIPLLARILAVADTYDAITTDRPYRKGPGHEFAVNEIKCCSGTQFAPEVVKAFLQSSICEDKPESVISM